MRVVVVGTVAVLLLVLALAFPIHTRLPLRPPVPAIAAGHANLIDSFCVSCHDSAERVADLALDSIDFNKVTADAATWEKVLKKLHAGMMPPRAQPRPADSDTQALIGWLESTLDSAAQSAPNPGRAPLHRLNRAEYGNAIRDLLALDIEVAELLPPDTESHGFDNIADVLTVSPSLMEQYLVAARRLASLALGRPAITPLTQVYRLPPERAQAEHIEGLPLGTRGGTLIEQHFPLDADYDMRVFLTRNIVGYMTGLEWPHQLEISVDGERAFIAQVGGEADNLMSDTNFAAAGNAIDARLRTRLPLTAGPHRIAVTFIKKNSAETHEPLELHTRELDLQNMNGLPTVNYITITGPLAPKGPGDTPSRSRILSCRPASADAELACATEIVSTLARRAFRRPVTDRDLDLLLRFYADGRATGSFDAGIESALRMVLASPEFLFRAEPDPAGVAPGSIYPLSDLQLASRLSFFLWSSIPDDELLAVAERGELLDPPVFEQQVRRMLADPRADALTWNFAGQWLFLRNLASANPDEHIFPDFDDNLRQAFRSETELFFASIVREDHSVLDLLDADYTYLNERLADHYGVPNVYGSHFRRVHVTDDMRRGLLGQGSILTVTSYPNRTSPVLRGKWILDNLLGAPPPAPPANVPALEDSASNEKVLSVREMVEEHRRNPACASCHAIMDPLGFALENFDAVGRWRGKDEAGPIDAAGELADGTLVDNPASLRQALLRQPEKFVATLSEKLLTYALGRGLEYYDMPVVRAIARETAADDYRFSALVMNIVTSVPFRLKTAHANDAEGLSVASAQR